MKNILVIGATGQIGSELTLELRKRYGDDHVIAGYIPAAMPQGQLKAARALGMRDLTAITCIILPQALRLSIPGWANEFSILLKDSAVCYLLGTMEIMARVNAVAQRTHEHLAFFALAGVIYFVLTLIVLKLLRRLENKVQIPGYSAGTVGSMAKNTQHGVKNA